MTFIYIYILLLFCIAVIGGSVWRFSRLHFKVLAIFIAFTFLVELTALFLANMRGDNQSVYVVYNIINISFTSWFFQYVLQQKVYKKVVIYLGIALLGFYCYNKFFENYWQMSSILGSVRNIVFAFFCLLFLYETLQYPTKKSLQKYPEFIFVMSALFFSAVSIFFWAVRLRPVGNALMHITYPIYLFSNYCFYIGIGISFFLEKNRRRLDGRNI